MCLPLWLALVLALRAFAPVYQVRFKELFSSRLGHFALEPEMYLAHIEISGRKAPGVDLFYLDPYRLSNRQLAKMWARKLHIFRWARPLHCVNKWFAGWERHEVPWRDVFTATDRELSLTEPHIAFSAAEIAHGDKCLRALLGNRTGPIVCVFSRDSAYLSQHAPHRSWSYHDYRDTNIENYIPTMEWLAENGYVVFRMGAAVKSALPEGLNSNIIDYATHHRSDFMDVFIVFRCAFQIVTPSGPSALGNLFRKPQVYTNSAPLLTVSVPKGHPEELMIPKLYRSEKDGRFLSVKEIVGKGLATISTLQELEAANVILTENDPTDILNLAKEIAGRCTEGVTFSDEDRELQRRFWIDAGQDPDAALAIPQPSPSFLRRHKDILFGTT